MNPGLRKGPVSNLGRCVTAIALVMAGVLWPALVTLADTAEIARLIRQLGSETFRERQAATKSLEAVGEPALGALEEAAASAEDAEVRRRAQQLVETIKDRLARSGEARRLGGHTEPVAQAAFSPDGRLVLTSGFDKTARLWEISSGKELRRLEGHRGPARGVAFSADGRYLLTGSGDDEIKDAKRVTSDCTVRLWEAASGKLLRSFTGHTDLVFWVAFSPDGRHILSAGALDDSTLRLWDVETGEQLRLMKNPYLTCAVLSPDGTRILAGNEDRTLRLWEVASGKELLCLRGHMYKACCVAFSPDGRRALSGGGGYPNKDAEVRLWDVEKGRELRRFEGHADIVWSVTFSPDGRRALSASSDKSVRLWDVETGKELRHFVGEGDWGGRPGLAFSPDGRRAFAVSQEDCTLWQWALPK